MSEDAEAPPRAKAPLVVEQCHVIMRLQRKRFKGLLVAASCRLPLACALQCLAPAPFAQVAERQAPPHVRLRLRLVKLALWRRHHL